MCIIKILFVAFAFSVLPFCASAQGQPPISSPNIIAQDFTLPDQNGKLWTLGEVLKNYRGVVLAFYPKDDTGL